MSRIDRIVACPLCGKDVHNLLLDRHLRRGHRRHQCPFCRRWVPGIALRNHVAKSHRVSLPWTILARLLKWFAEGHTVSEFRLVFPDKPTERRNESVSAGFEKAQCSFCREWFTVDTIATHNCSGKKAFLNSFALLPKEEHHAGTKICTCGGLNPDCAKCGGTGMME